MPLEGKLKTEGGYVQYFLAAIFIIKIVTIKSTSEELKKYLRNVKKCSSTKKEYWGSYLVIIKYSWDFW